MILNTLFFLLQFLHMGNVKSLRFISSPCPIMVLIMLIWSNYLSTKKNCLLCQDHRQEPEPVPRTKAESLQIYVLFLRQGCHCYTQKQNLGQSYCLKTCYFASHPQSVNQQLKYPAIFSKNIINVKTFCAKECNKGKNIHSFFHCSLIWDLGQTQQIKIKNSVGITMAFAMEIFK